jgi:D-glycero-alpha-D-manno-heptose-7-phosphate kinase
MITAKCPLRISLAGGSTDLQNFIDQHEKGSVINFPINLYTYVTISHDVFGYSSQKHKYIVNYIRREEVATVNEIENDIVRECFSYFGTKPNTCSLTSDVFSSGSGLASSSSYLIAFITALCKQHKLNLNKQNLCELALKIERKFNPLTGYQDPYGCGSGGLKRIDIKKPGEVTIKSLKPDIFNHFDMHLYHTGIYRSSTKLLSKVDANKSIALLDCVEDMESCIQEQDVEKFIQTIKDGWDAKKESCPSVVDNNKVREIDKDLSSNSNVLAHRLCGAGNGGFYLVFTKKNKWNFKKNTIQVNIDNEGPVAYKL